MDIKEELEKLLEDIKKFFEEIIEKFKEWFSPENLARIKDALDTVNEHLKKVSSYSVSKAKELHEHLKSKFDEVKEKLANGDLEGVGEFADEVSGKNVPIQKKIVKYLKYEPTYFNTRNEGYKTYLDEKRD